jgi:hypothetical protein
MPQAKPETKRQLIAKLDGKRKITSSRDCRPIKLSDEAEEIASLLDNIFRRLQTLENKRDG